MYDDCEVIAAGMHDDTLPMDWQRYAERPDWRIRQVRDVYGWEVPEDHGMPPTITDQGTRFNMDLGPLDVDYTGAFYADDYLGVVREYGEEFAERWARIFYGVHVDSVDVDGGRTGVTVFDTPEWRKAVGVPSDYVVDAAKDAAEVIAWLEGEVYHLVLEEWDADAEEYVEVDAVHGFYGRVDAERALRAFGKDSQTTRKGGRVMSWWHDASHEDLQTAEMLRDAIGEALVKRARELICEKIGPVETQRLTLTEQLTLDVLIEYMAEHHDADGFNDMSLEEVVSLAPAWADHLVSEWRTER